MRCEHAGTGRQARLRGVCLWRVGSSPTARTIILPDSVTVSTSDSDSLCLGSNPSQAARKKHQSCIKIDAFFNEIHLWACAIMLSHCEIAPL